MKFTLNFLSDNYGKKKIDEPFGTSDINFSLKQKEKGMGRDVSFSGNEIQFEFTDKRNHELKQLLYYHRKFGFESVVVLTIEIDENNKYNCDLDFATAETDDLTYFRCKGIEDSKLQIVKARKEVKVDLLSDVDVDGNFIGGLVPENILLLAKPVIQASEWKRNEPFAKKFVSYGQDSAYLSIVNTIERSGIESTLVPFADYQEVSSNVAVISNYDVFNPLVLLEAQNNLKDIKVVIKGVTLSMIGGFTNKFLYVVTSNNGLWAGGGGTTYKLETLTTGGDISVVNKDYFVEIPSLPRGAKLAIYAAVVSKITVHSPTPVATTAISLTLSGGVTISTESTSYNSISKSLRLVDVIRQVVKSISGLDINAPRFDALGQFYDNRLFNGNFLRGITDKPFYVSLEDIEKSLPEMHGDWEIGSDGKIFFGIEEDFYTNNEVGFFNNTQFSEMNKTFNPKYKINEFLYKYRNYQSLKENEEPNSADTIHGESRFVFFNKAVENKKQVEIDWTRDAFLIESTRRKALTITTDTASQDDDTIFCIDSIDTTFDNEFTEVTQLEHTYNPTTFLLSLRNDGTINFLSLGITVDSYFYIKTVDINAGTYRVESVTNNTLELSRVLGIVSGAGAGNRLTKYTYTLPMSVVPFTNYTNQGFSETSGLGSADNYSNRRYSIKRNIHNHYKSYLATANLYWKNNPLKNTWYKNNGDYTAKYNGVKLTEKADFVPDNPILSPVLYDEMVFRNVHFEEFIALQIAIRSQRGFIRAIDNNDQVIKVYPIDVEYSLLEKELRIKAEEKYKPTSMSISTEFPYILINNETRVDSLLWEIKNEKLYIFDENRYRLYNGVFWHEVSINGAFASSKEILEGRLNLL